jgi:membrane protein DedA with SNARE-associated domain
VPDLGTLVIKWSYAAIVVGLVLGNLGLPVPEETILAVAGYAAWRGILSLPAVVALGTVSAILGDNLGYWVGRRYGREVIARHGRRIGITAERLDRLAHLVARYGALAVFVARFVPGLRFLGGPLAGAGGLAPARFLLANALGALVYVPYAVGLGYALGYGFGDRLHRTAGDAEILVVGVVVLGLVAWFAARLRKARRAVQATGPGLDPPGDPGHPHTLEEPSAPARESRRQTPGGDAAP